MSNVRYVLYQPPTETRPPWPAVVITDTMVPIEILHKRPYGYNVPILLLQKWQVRWVIFGNLRDPGDMTFSQEHANKHPGLQDAFTSMITAIADNQTLSDWRAIIEVFYGQESMQEQDLEQDSEVVEDDVSVIDEDADVAVAIRASLEDQSSKKRSAHDAFSSSEHTSQKGCHYGPMTPPESQDSLFMPERTSGYNASVTRGRINRKKTLLRSWDAETSLAEHPEQDLEASLTGKPGNVEFFVGAHRTQFTIPAKFILPRSYFYDDRNFSGQNYVRERAPDDYVFERPCLREITPKDFELAKQYLETGRFGQQSLDNDEAKGDCLVECAAAWEVADTLGMTDFKGHIVRKLQQAMPWPPSQKITILSITTVAFRDPDSCPAHRILKNLLSGYIADNLWSFWRDYASTMIEKLEESPDLEADINDMRNMKLKPEEYADDNSVVEEEASALGRDNHVHETIPVVEASADIIDLGEEPEQADVEAQKNQQID